jgi:hypothetical protein
MEVESTKSARSSPGDFPLDGIGVFAQFREQW